MTLFFALALCALRAGIGDGVYALCSRPLAGGDKNQVKELVERVRNDYRDIIFWSENPAEVKLDTPAKIEEFNKMLKQLGAKWQFKK